MKTIYKYPLVMATSLIEMNADSQILDVHEQAGDACLWATVDPTCPIVTREFCVVPTGGSVPERSTYVGTAHFNVWPPLVVHVFEVPHE
jgi:hypothetical protein